MPVVRRSSEIGAIEIESLFLLGQREERPGGGQVLIRCKGLSSADSYKQCLQIDATPGTGYPTRLGPLSVAVRNSRLSWSRHRDLV